MSQLVEDFDGFWTSPSYDDIFVGDEIVPFLLGNVEFGHVPPFFKLKNGISSSFLHVVLCPQTEKIKAEVESGGLETSEQWLRDTSVG